VYSTLNVILQKEKKEQSQVALLDHSFGFKALSLGSALRRWIFVVGFYMAVIEVMALLVTQALGKWVVCGVK